MSDEKLTSERASEILGVDASASSEERHRVFQEKRTILEKKLGSAPTGGLKAKYRASIDELERAFELLELAQTKADLGVIRPVLVSAKSPASERSLSAAPHPAASSPGGPNAASSPKNRVGGRDVWMGFAAVALVVVALGGWFWKANADRAAEESRQLELAKQEAIARATHDAAEKKAAEERAAQLRNEEERKRDLERKARSTLANLETELEGLDQELRDCDRSLADLKTTEREQSRTTSRDLEWTRQARIALEDYRAWLSDFSARHPARVRLRTARELLQGKDVEGAAQEAMLGEEDWKQRLNTLGERKSQEAEARRVREREEKAAKRVPRIAGTYRGRWQQNDGFAYERTVVINPDLRSGTDHVELRTGAKMQFPLVGEGSETSFEGWNIPTEGSNFSADRLTIRLSEDGLSIGISLKDLRGNVGSGVLQRVK